MIKSIKGSSLPELDKEVNMFMSQYEKAKVLSFQAIPIGSIQKLTYIYIIEYTQNGQTECDYNDEDLEIIIDKLDKNYRTQEIILPSELAIKNKRNELNLGERKRNE